MKNFQNKKIRYAKLGDCINVNSLVYEKTLKQSVIGKQINGKEALELGTIYNHYLL